MHSIEPASYLREHRAGPAAAPADYAELRCRSAHSFLHGASRPEELVERAGQLGYRALALTDEGSLGGVVRAHQAAKAQGLPLIVGSQFQVAADAGCAAYTLVALAADRDGYGHLCQLVSRLRGTPGPRSLTLHDDELARTTLTGCIVLAVPQRDADDAALHALAQRLRQRWAGRCWIGVELGCTLDDAAWLPRLRQAAATAALPLVACGDVRMHRRSRKPLLDVMTAIRLGRPLADCGRALALNAEPHLRSRERLARLYPPELLHETLRVAERCRFSLDELRGQYPDEVVPAGHSPASYLRQLTAEGAQRRWPQGVPASVQRQIEHELALIDELGYAHYFLTVADLVRFARSRAILCQGRGSAANSAVCYCLGVTEVDPARMATLFERFVSRERREPPDIDIDFEHERREEVIQYLYARYGRERAALAAVVVCYRTRSALRDVGKALGIEPQRLAALLRAIGGRDALHAAPARLAEAGLDPHDLQLRQWLQLAGELQGLPRHLGQHVGGFVLTRERLDRIVPIVAAAMPGRTVIEWDKDDLDAMGLLKVDVLALGMLSAIRKALALVGARRGRPFAMQDIPAEDMPTYDLFCRADTVGVFQIESRAQMAMLPRLRPRCFYDLVIEVALVRPGPIQGGMVHPYLQRRQGLQPVTYPSAALAQALGRTLGVPVFQEQVMQISILAAGFSPGEADGLRRAMAAWKRGGDIERYRERLVQGMTARGHDAAYAQAIFEQIRGFSEYGFPESHAASFALLVYASGWLKCHHPAEFLAALLNSQPMGFYTPRQLVDDARRRGVEVRPIDVGASDWDCTLEDLPAPSAMPSAVSPAVRLGLRLVRGLGRAAAARIVAARAQAPFADVDDLARRADLPPHETQRLAAADALAGLAGHRRQQVWAAAAQQAALPLLRDAPIAEAPLALPPPPEGEDIVLDHAATGLSLRRHPLALLRPLLARRRLLTAQQLRGLPASPLVRACGLVTLRQQPATAGGVVFVTLEDETGVVQVICWKSLRERQRSVLLHARLLAVRGRWQREGEVGHLVAAQLEDLTALLGRLPTLSRDFR
jgi:error-prone DNA polymerase